MFVLEDSYVMEKAVETFRKEDLEVEFNIVIGMASGDILRFRYRRKRERDEKFEALVKHLENYQRCNGIFGPV